MSTATEAPSKLEARTNESEFAKLDLEQIHADPEMNGRSTGYEDVELEGLAASIESKGGLIQSMAVCRTPADKLDMTGGKPYILIAGYRRYYALSKLAKDNQDDQWLKRQPCLIQPGHDLAKFVGTQLVENVQRLDMNPMDIATQVEYAVAHCGVAVRDLAAQCGKDPSWVSQYRKLLKLPAEVQALIENDKLTFSAARELMRLPEDQWAKAAVVASNMSFGEWKEHVDTFLEDNTDGKGDASVVSESAQKLQNSIKTKTIETKYLPQLKKELAEATDDSVKSQLQSWLDALQFVLDGADSGTTQLAKHLAPFEAAEKAEKAKAAETEKAERGFNQYLAMLMKTIRETIKPANYKPGDTIPSVADAIIGVKKKVSESLKDGKLTWQKLVPAKEEGEADKIETYTFDVPDLEQFMTGLGEHWEADVKKRIEDAKKREAKKKEAEAKAAAEKAELVAAGSEE